MYTCIITGGPDISSEASSLALSCDSLICADSGFDYAVANGLADRVVSIYGDFDSLTEEGKKVASEMEINMLKYPIEKDMTDTELILSELIKANKPDDQYVLITSMGGRMDHFFANATLMIKYHALGMDITATDGITDLIPLCGEDSISIKLVEEGFEHLNVSLIPLEDATGVSSSGLYYPLENNELHLGDTLSVSNHPVSDEICVNQKSGKTLLVICR